MAVFTLLSPIEACTQQDLAVPTGGTTEGDFIAIGSINGFYFTTTTKMTENETLASLSTQEVRVVAITRAPKVRATKASGTVTQGAKLYYDSGNANVTTASTGNTLIGAANEAAASGATTIEMDFDGFLANF